ncbi:MAG: HAD family hydrolase [Clostridia bacterium]|nr:HAD family hydrolase [Clostridia bacterium]
MRDIILFDLDGTLTDPALGITNSILHALSKMGRELPSRESLYRFIGPPLVPAFQEFLGMTEEEAQRALVLYREYFSVTGLFENTVYGGIADALEKLKHAGCTLVLATSKPEQFAVRILGHFDLAQYFTLICGASMDEKRNTKDAVIGYALEKLGQPDKSRVIMVGDRHHDVEGAAKFGIPTVGVLWGYGSRDELTDAGAAWLAADVGEMVRGLMR